MKQKKRFVLLLLALALMSAALQGCAIQPPLPEELSTSAPSDAPHLPYDKYEEYDEYERPAEPLDEPVPFAELAYARPDAAGLIGRIEKAERLAADGADADEILDVFAPAYDDYIRFSTMSEIANVRYSLNLGDTFYEDEYNWCQEQLPKISQAMERAYVAMGRSAERVRLEWRYFGAGFFDYYNEDEFDTTSDRAVALMQEEDALEARFMALQNGMTILWKGEERPAWELLNSPALSYQEYLEAYRLFYEKYTPDCAEILAGLIRARRALAAELGYASYAELAYDSYYERDYTPAQAASYTADIAAELAPLSNLADTPGYTREMDARTLLQRLREGVYSLGGELATAFDYMEDYGLYDFTASEQKLYSSFTTYFESYEMPFLFLTPEGSSYDLLSAAHEFGHFTDAFVNCNMTTSVDCAEVFSQGLEYLILERAGLNSRESGSLKREKLADSLMTFLGQACYAEFERRVYELPDSELTAERFNEVYLECCEEFGLPLTGDDAVDAPGWMEVEHFYLAPLYVISYCVSNDAALQIYQLDEESGKGVAAYFDLMHNASYNTILALLDEAGMTSPFAEGRAAALAELFREELGNSTEKDKAA